MGQTAAASVGNEDKMVRLNLDIADLSAEAVYCVPVPCVGYWRKVWSCIDGAVGTADVTITPTVNGAAITGGVITIATASSAAGDGGSAVPPTPPPGGATPPAPASSAAGDVDSAVPETCPRLVPGDYLKFTVTGGGSGGSPRGHLAIEIERD